MPALSNAGVSLKTSNLIVAILFFLSGFTSLIYEVVWFRQLALVFGNTALATSTMLAFFFAGLALGSILFGRIADHSTRRLLIYGLLEAGIGIYALIFPALLQLSNFADASFYKLFGSTELLCLSRAIVCAFLLLPPTILMGGTFPLLAKQMIMRLDDVSRGISWLYFVNTAGAVAGSLSAGFVFIAEYGMRTTTLIAVVINFAVFGFSVFIQKLAGSAPKIDSTQEVGVPAETSGKWILLATFASGFASLVYEVVWIRSFSTYFGSSVYSFSAIVGVFLIGIAVGIFTSEDLLTHGAHLAKFSCALRYQ
jgi:spermidine synthase